MSPLARWGIRQSFNDEREIVGIYKREQLTDPDAIYAKKLELLRPARARTNLGWFSLALIVLLIWSALGIIAVPFFIWMPPYGFYTGYRQRRMIQAGTRRHCMAIGIDPV